MDLSWMDDAACLGIDVNVFFPPKAAAKANGAISGKSICDGCDVRERCLEYALATNQRTGIWGGTSGNERLKMRTGAEEPEEAA